MQGFESSVTEVLEWFDVLETLGFDRTIGAFVQDSEAKAYSTREAIEDITTAKALLDAVECFLRQPTLVAYLALLNLVPWAPEIRKEMLTDFELFRKAQSAISPEPASSEIGAVAPVTLDHLHNGAALALGVDNAAAG